MVKLCGRLQRPFFTEVRRSAPLLAQSFYLAGYLTAQLTESEMDRTPRNKIMHSIYMGSGRLAQ
jgi:hypothetical protein